MLSLEDRLKIPDRFTVIPAGPDEFRLHSLGFSLALSGRSPHLLSRLLPLLDGSRTVGEILLELEAVDRESVSDTMEYLVEVGALERPAPAEPGGLSSVETERYRPQIAFFSGFVAPSGAAQQASAKDVPKSGLEYQHVLKKSHVAVFGAGRLGSQLIRWLAISGVGTITAVDPCSVEEEDLNGDALFQTEQKGANRARATGVLCAAVNAEVTFQAVEESKRSEDVLRRCDLAVLCPDRFNPSEYEEFNRAAIASSATWTSARTTGYEFLIGPTIIPGETPCFHCFNMRLKSNVPDLSEYVLVEQHIEKGKLKPERLAITPGIGLLALEVLKVLTWFMPPATYGHLYSLSLLTMQSKLHPILKIPRCSDCGRPAMSRPSIHVWQQSKAEPQV